MLSLWRSWFSAILGYGALIYTWLVTDVSGERSGLELSGINAPYFLLDEY